jgi:hypothetical protein
MRRKSRPSGSPPVLLDDTQDAPFLGRRDRRSLGLLVRMDNRVFGARPAFLESDEVRLDEGLNCRLGPRAPDPQANAR